MEAERLGLVPGRVLDSLAPHVFQLLRDRYLVQIPDALAVLEMETRYKRSPLSIYQALENPQDAELFSGSVSTTRIRGATMKQWI